MANPTSVHEPPAQSESAALPLDDLLRVLPSVVEPPPLAPGAPPEVCYVDSCQKEFVEPSLMLHSGAIDSAQVIVIEAPAAVGKTMLSRHLSFRLNAVHWDLAKSLVGDNFAIGTLANAHGDAELPETLRRLHAGELVIVADALDEARLRVGFDAFAAFLNDLAKRVLSTAVPGALPVVLLARAETAELTVEWLEDDADVAVAHLGIELFDREEAERFVDRQLEATGTLRNDATKRALGSMFGHVLSLFGVEEDAPHWPVDARRFLGYAPVLVTISRYLEGGNPQRIAEQFAKREAPPKMWDLLMNLVENILEREQQKFVENFKKRLEPDVCAQLTDAEWQGFFGPEEQQAWLLHRTLDASPPTLGLPPELEPDYRAQVHEWLPDHPFSGAPQSSFASPVFEDFVYAEALARGSAIDKAVVRNKVAAASYRPTEMLSRFLLAIPCACLEGGDLPALYESVTAAGEAGHTTHLHLTDEDKEALEASVEIGEERVGLELLGDGAPIAFTRRLRHVVIDLDRHPVRLGIAGLLFEMGPNVSLRAPEIEIAADSLLVRAGAGAPDRILLSAEKVVASQTQLQIAGAGDRLAIRAAHSLAYPLVQHQEEREEVEVALGGAERAAGRTLFRLVGYFKSEGYAGLGSHAEPIDRRAGRNPLFAKVFEHALSTGLISKAGRIYQLHPEKIGLDYSQVRSHVISAETASFLRDLANDGERAAG